MMLEAEREEDAEEIDEGTVVWCAGVGFLLAQI